LFVTISIFIQSMNISIIKKGMVITWLIGLVFVIIVESNLKPGEGPMGFFYFMFGALSILYFALSVLIITLLERRKPMQSNTSVAPVAPKKKSLLFYVCVTLLLLWGVWLLGSTF